MNHSQKMTVLLTALMVIFSSVVFFAVYYAVQFWFATPYEVESFIQKYRQENEDAGLTGNTGSTVNSWAGQTRPGQIPGVRRELLYLTGENNTAVITVLDSGTGKLGFYTLPADTLFELTETQYQDMAARYPAIPQMFWAEVLGNYMEAEEAAAVLAELLAEKLYCTFDRVAVLPLETLEGWCVWQDNMIAAGESLLAFLEKDTAARAVLQKLRDWERLCAQEDDSVYVYAETIAMLDAASFTAMRIPGRKEKGGYRMDTERARAQIAVR